MEPFNDNFLREKARKRVAFKIHLIVYCVVNASLWFIWWITGSGYPWPVWPVFGWGIGLIFHYLFEYRSSHFLSEEEEYKKLKDRMEEEQGSVHT